jgi:Zn-dependent protease with chaperone function
MYSEHSATWQYRGDREDIEVLHSDYCIDYILNAAEAERSALSTSARGTLLREGIRLSPVLSPRVFDLIEEACVRISADCDLEVFCSDDPGINAYTCISGNLDKVQNLLCISARALEDLSDSELLHLIGHELGHIVFGHTRINGLVKSQATGSGVTVLPYLGESLFLQWRKKAEISADRAGFLACGNFNSGAKAILKAAIGLTEKNLNLDIEELLSQVNDAIKSPEGTVSEFESHPLLPVRLKALELFAVGQQSRSLSHTNGKWLEEVDAAIDALLDLTARYPKTELEQACMTLIADSGVRLVKGDGEIGLEEVKRVITCLHRHYTDAPEKQICRDPTARKTRMLSAVRILNGCQGVKAKHIVLSRLADIAIADGKLLQSEGQVILELATALHVPKQEAYSIITGCTQRARSVEDPCMLRIANDLRDVLGSEISGTDQSRNPHQQ